MTSGGLKYIFIVWLEKVSMEFNLKTEGGIILSFEGAVSRAVL